MAPNMLTIDQVAERLQLSRNTVCRHAAKGILPKPVRLGGAVRFPPPAIEAIERGELPDAESEDE